MIKKININPLKSILTKFEIKQESLRGDNGTEKKKIDLSIQFLIN